MTPREALADRTREARRFKYIPDPEGPDPIAKLLNDEWDTVREFEERGGGDCDGFGIRTIERAYEDAISTLAPGDPLGVWHLIAGHVRQYGAWIGHAWVMLASEADVLWADPTWGRLPGPPGALGYPAARRPKHRWTFNGVIFVDQQDYEALA